MRWLGGLEVNTSHCLKDMAPPVTPMEPPHLVVPRRHSSIPACVKDVSRLPARSHVVPTAKPEAGALAAALTLLR